MCLIHFIKNNIKQKNKFSKVFPILTKKCCICYDEKINIIECINPICNDGIICIECFEKFDDRQKQVCPLCREKQFAIITDRIKKEKKINDKKKKKIKTNKCKLYCFEKIKITLCTIICMGGSYAIGLFLIFLFFSQDLNITVKTTNPMFFMIIGFIFIIIIIFLCICCFRLRENMRN